MDCNFLMICFAALVIPTMQFDDRKFSWQNTRLARVFDNLKRSGAKIRGNLEISGPLGGKIEANLDGALGRVGNLFNAETRGHLRGGIRSRGPLGEVNGAAGGIEGVLSRAPDGSGANIAGRLDHVTGNIFTGVRRSGVSGEFQTGTARSGGFPFDGFDNSYTSSLIGRVVGGQQCSAVPRSCFGVRPRGVNAVRRFVFDDRENRCVQDYVSRTCARQGVRNNIFRTRRECRQECNCD